MACLFFDKLCGGSGGDSVVPTNQAFGQTDTKKWLLHILEIYQSLNLVFIYLPGPLFYTDKILHIQYNDLGYDLRQVYKCYL